MSICQSDHARRGDEGSGLPPGFRFHPTDEELVRWYLTQKVMNKNSVFLAIGEVDFNKCEPWDLPAKAKMGESVLYFFSRKDKKYPTGMRTNRATEAGYWKATGKDREVIIRGTGRILGMKKTLVFYRGRAPKGEKTNWIMHEYRLERESDPDQEDWVVCRVFNKSVSSKMTPESSNNTSYNVQYSNDQPSSFLPDLSNLESPGPSPAKPIYKYADPSPLVLYEPQGPIQDASFPVHEKILKRSNSSMTTRKEMHLGDTLENLVSGWDVYTPEPIWNVSPESRFN